MASSDSSISIDPPFPYRHRAATTGDVQEATDFFNLCEIEESGVPDYEVEEVVDEWSVLDLSRDLLLVATPEYQIVGSMTVTPRGGGVLEASGYTHPEHKGRGIGDHIVAWSEHRAAQHDGSNHPVARSLLRNWILSTNQDAVRLLTGRGYQHVKRFMRMEIALESEPEPVHLPEGFTLRAFDADRDLVGVHSVVETSFSEHWQGFPRTFEDWRKTALGMGYDPSLWTQVFRGDERVGVAVGQNLAGYGWIKWVGVLKAERGQGLGAAMLRDQFARFWRLGLHTIGLGVDSENTTGAQDLYLKAGMKLSRSYDAYEKRV